MREANFDSGCFSLCELGALELGAHESDAILGEGAEDLVQYIGVFDGEADDLVQ